MAAPATPNISGSTSQQTKSDGQFGSGNVIFALGDDPAARALSAPEFLPVTTRAPRGGSVDLSPFLLVGGIVAAVLLLRRRK